MVHDVVIVGAGPAGLAAAINGASEGLSIALVDRALELGGQARESACVENYPLPFSDYKGVSGSDMMSGFSAQAERFGTTIISPTNASRLHTQDNGVHCILTDDMQRLEARTVLLSVGLSYRRLRAEGLTRFMGRGVYYGAPPLVRGDRVAIVGGANSAGQAAVRLAQQCNHVTLIARSPIEKSMSKYLVDRLRASAKVEIVENAEIVRVDGGRELESVDYRIKYAAGDQSDHRAEIDRLFIFIGAVPYTGWLQGTVRLCNKGFIVTDSDIPAEMQGEHTQYPCSTTIPGIFAAGDARFGQGVKRITGAVFDGVCAIQGIHQYLGAEQ